MSLQPQRYILSWSHCRSSDAVPLCFRFHSLAWSCSDCSCSISAFAQSFSPVDRLLVGQYHAASTPFRLSHDLFHVSIASSDQYHVASSVEDEITETARIQWPTCMIASLDYCHAPLGVSLFSFSIQNVWEMTTMVDKIQ